MKFATSLSEVAQLGLELHVFHVQDSAQRRVESLIDEAASRGQRQQIAYGLVSPAYTALAYVALLTALAVAYFSDAADLTSLGAVMIVMMRSLSYGQSLQSSFTAISNSVPYIEEIQMRLSHFLSVRRDDGGQHVESVREIAVEDLRFSYSPGQEVLKGLTFTIHPREIVGIVGPSGGGKSTLVQLLLGLRDPDSGTIKTDGHVVSDFSKAEWARKVTFVPQASHLIAGSIADNIRFLRDEVSQEEVERAARLAYLHDDVMEFPEGYDRQVGEQGGHLSGGQQQRLCIARALVETPDVLILDEPTSALDVRSEHLIRATLSDLKSAMTVIVIAHRLSTLDICDRIMVIQAGQLRGFDTPARLEETNEFYREALVLSGMR